MYTNQCTTGTLTLVAATPLTVTIQCAQYQNIGITISNTGVTNPINTTVVKRSADGVAANEGTDTASGTAIGSIATSSVALLEITCDALCCRYMKLVFTSTSGTTAVVSWIANRTA